MKMKNKVVLFISIVAFGINFSLLAKDLITLNNSQKFEGKVVKLKDCSLIFKSNGAKFEIPAESIFSIEFDDLNNKLYKAYLYESMSNYNLCFQAQIDAKNFHGKKESHFILGLLFGPFAIIGTALANPTPYNSSNMIMMGDGRDDPKFSDPVYLDCYKKKAKSGLIGVEGLGWLSWILILLVAGA